MAHDIFISYSSKDKVIADAVCAKLENNNIRCWIAPRDILPGHIYAESIIDAINQSNIFVLILSSNSDNSNQVIREVENAVSNGVSIIPFRIEDFELSKSMKYFVSSTHWLDALTPPMEEHIHKLIKAVKALLNVEESFKNIESKELILDENYHEDIEINDLFLNDEKWSNLEQKLQDESALHEVVIEGYDYIDKNLPMGRFGKLITVVPLDIKNYQNITNIVRNHLENKNSTRPISIAVFGPPSSGKTFNLTQIIESVAGSMIEILNFDVAIFNNPSDIIFALHQVYNSEVNGKVPVVFFKNFDVPFNRYAVGWLKYFIEPMDGIFREGNELKQIKRAIFVFETGTMTSFNNFSRFISEDFIERGKDFIGRLNAYVDIFGINKNDEDDNEYIIRRAVLLRLILEKNAHNIFDGQKALIDSRILEAFLFVPKYKNNVRSMESIIEMSMLQNKKSFEKSSIPPESQLNMYVDAKIFSEIVLRE